MFICWLEVLYIAWALLGRQNQTIKHERKVFGQDLIIESIHATTQHLSFIHAITQHLSFIIVIIDADKLQTILLFVKKVLSLSVHSNTKKKKIRENQLALLVEVIRGG